MRTSVSTKSPLMQFVPGPRDRATRSPVGRVPDALEKAALGRSSLFIPPHQLPDGLRGQAGHGLVLHGGFSVLPNYDSR